MHFLFIFQLKKKRTILELKLENIITYKPKKRKFLFRRFNLILTVEIMNLKIHLTRNAFRLVNKRKTYSVVKRDFPIIYWLAATLTT